MKKELMEQIEAFQRQYPVEEQVRGRILQPSVRYIGEEVLEQAATALLQGENLLLVGDKATGKNVLADTLAGLFGRPEYNVSFHVNTDSSTLIGADTFVQNEVRLREGPIASAARVGGFCILDEINMAKNDAIAVLHSALDYRRIIDVPGYSLIKVHPAARFIATMNYGYAGTKELNEALCSRFAVIRMPKLQETQLAEILSQQVPDMAPDTLKQCIALYLELNEKAVNGEISTRAVDLRGLLLALSLIKSGLAPLTALQIGIVNKCFDEYEYQLVNDVVMTRFA